MQALRDGKYNDAEFFLVSGTDVLKQNGATNSHSYLLCLTQLGIIYKKNGNEKSFSEIEMDLLAMEMGLRPGSKRELNYNYQLGVFYSEIGLFQKSMDYLSKALESEAIRKSPEMEAKIYHRQALVFYCLGDMSKAISIQEKAVAKDINSNPSYRKALVHYYFAHNEWSKLDQEISATFDNCREQVLRQFTHSNAKSRASYWNTSGLFFTKFIPYYVSRHQSGQMVGNAYNAALFSKGLLLTATTKSADLIIDNNNIEMVNAYNRYLSLKGINSRTLEQEFELQALEDMIVRYQKEHKNDYRKDFRITWTDVKNNLKPNDVAIEFIAYPGNDGQEHYAALVLKKSYSVPKFVPLSTLGQISTVHDREIYVTPLMYDYVWGPLEPEINSADNIFFSPTGVFHKIGIEYLPDSLGHIISNKHKVFRLSSTKELVLSNKRSIKKGVLIGGVDYNASIVELSKQTPTYNQLIQDSYGTSLDSLDLRGADGVKGFPFLAGTMEEVDEISTEIMGSELELEVLIGEDGSETNLKNLTSRDVNLLHIATHGFSYSNPIRSNNPSVEKLFLDMSLHDISEDVIMTDEDKMMTRSGLVLAGANNVVRKVKIPKGVEDGILYADEVSSINLSSVDLLVLSACQSGLGDISSYEGVFGLQRGFKLSGVGSIIMSLWKVSDSATRLLMSELYKNLLKGQQKREALVNAQMTLRTCENGKFDKPEYWAAFILLDGIN